MHNSLCFPMHTLPFQSHFYGGEKTLSPSHFSWLYFHQGRTGEGSLRIEKCCSCNTSKIAGFYLDWARKFWAFFCLTWKTKTLSDCRKKGEEREQRRKGGKKKRKQERKKKVPTISADLLVLCSKSGLDQQWEFWRSFLSPLPLHSFSGLCTTSPSPPNKHNPGFCREIWEDASTCAHQVEREKKSPKASAFGMRLEMQTPGSHIGFESNQQHLFIHNSLLLCSLIIFSPSEEQLYLVS